MINFNACPEKYTSYLGLSNVQRNNFLPQISVSITSFSPNYCSPVVVGLLHVWLIRDIFFFVTGNHQDSLRDAEAAIELNPTFLKAIVRG